MKFVSMMSTALILLSLTNFSAASRSMKTGSRCSPVLFWFTAPRRKSLKTLLSSSTTAKRMRPSASPPELPPKTKPSNAVIASGTMRLMSHGSGLRHARRRSLARRTRNILFPEFAARELQKNIVQARTLERNIFDANGQVQQFFQTLRRITRANRRDDQLLFRFLNYPEPLMKTIPGFRGSIFEIRLQHEHAVAAEPVLQFAERA